MQIAIILPSLAKKGPILVAKELADALFKYNVQIHVYYFDEKVEIDFPGKVEKIKIFDRLNFEKFDVVHSHGIRPDFFVYLNRKRIDGVKVSTMHNYISQDLGSVYGKFNGKLIQLLWIYILKGHDYIVCLSQLMKNYYSKFINQSKLKVIYNGRTISKTVVSDKDKLQTVQDFKQDSMLLGVVAQLIRRKGIHQIIEILEYLENVKLLIIGDGPELSNLKNLATSKGVTEKILFLGFEQEPFSYYPLIDVYVCSSFSEGFPLSMLEAGQFKIPVIASDLEIFRELFPEEIIFFQLNSAESLVKAIEETRTKREYYGEKIRMKINNEYSAKKMALDYLKVFKND
ncbi:Glycosyltransferase involved in cell wall bisynthesis [Marivirga sericea]|uniref:Glycosyltransferase involved in cell wall bisynthesis n=1 Tax=Marivirga sericea TaxID=1028 RepID=A0A1X7J7E5_9BACT|nr:glycosyltransferase family 4 protein [Marivirga sericea]SMG23440.1 Glycosyltransferase involved in cell wall bisynthesis [Marivirga sericea]